MGRRVISIEEQIDRQEAVVLAMKKKIDDMKAKYEAEIEKMAKLVEKKKPDMPQRIVNVIKCKNPRCITQVEQELDHVFVLTDKEQQVYRCFYCEAQSK